MKELAVKAAIENLDAVTDFVEEQLIRLGCSMEVRIQIRVAIDELFSNIAYYAYHPDTGPATVRVETVQDPRAVLITFVDRGVPYNPLAREDPDITLPADEREAGGLGIFMVKKTMDDVRYEYKDGENILRIRKNIGKDEKEQ